MSLMNLLLISRCMIKIIELKSNITLFLVGFEGYNCEVNTNECSSSPCLNGAACYDRINGYRCICLPGFRGDHCEENIDDCRPDVCANGGTCVDGVNE